MDGKVSRNVTNSVSTIALAAVVLVGCVSATENSSAMPAMDIESSSPIDSPLTSGELISRSPSINDQTPTAKGPLDSLLSDIFGPGWLDITDSNAMQIKWDSMVVDRGEFIAACMRESGFVYSPTTDLPPPRVPAMQPDASLYGTREFAQRYGFGVSIRPPAGSNTAQQPSRQTGPATVRFFGGPNPAEVSEAELEAWYVAMYGVTLLSLPPNAARSLEGFPWPEVPKADLGCETRWILHQSLPPEPFRALESEIERFDDAVAADPRTLALNASWRSCMIAAGETTASSPRDLTRQLISAYSAGQIPVTVFMEWDWETYPDGPAPVDRAEFQEREIAIAVADWDCREQLGYDAALREIDLDLQQQFVTLNYNELKAWVEYAEQLRIARQ